MKPIDLALVAKSFAAKRVLVDVGFHVDQGEVVGFVGPNGAGKTTCLRILVGLCERDGGTVQVLGLDPQSSSVAIRERCCYLPGETSVYLGMTGGAFLDFAWGFYPGHQEDLKQRMLAAFDLPLTRKVRAYSAGMKQRLALLACLAPDVDLYIFDEPDRALDATTRFFLRDLVRTLQAKGKTILLSSHHLREVEALADRLVFIMDGHVVEEPRITAARAELKKQLRIHLTEGTDLPAGARLLGKEPGGTMRVLTDSDPFQWLAQIPRQQVVAAEVGTIRLEDLYRMLMSMPEGAEA
ncbi:MAG: ABC transporter ATP-binding protein [Planctomycetota bacterium]|jgi:ABC-2 type transport system ATP-binding protein